MHSFMNLRCKNYRVILDSVQSIRCVKLLSGQTLLLLLALHFPQASAFEVNTHQALTRCAITPTCGNEHSLNLLRFVEEDADLKHENYDSQKFEGYKSLSYLQYAKRGVGLEEWKIGFTSSPSYIKLIEAGVVLEDAIWPTSDYNILGYNPFWAGADHSGDGRFLNHFYNYQGSPKRLTSRHGAIYGDSFTDAITWAIDGPVLPAVGEGDDLIRYNRYSLKEAFTYFNRSFTSVKPKARKEAQASLFVSLGHIVHLLQDLHSPAHTRNDSHPEGDALEKYGRQGRGGYRLKNGKLDPKSSADIGLAISERKSVKHTKYLSFFEQSARFSSTNFFSSDTIKREQYPFWKLGPRIKKTDKAYLVKAENIKHKLAIETSGGPKPLYAMTFFGDRTVLKQNSKILMPRAVGATVGFLDYFFRGSFKAILSNDLDVLTIENTSDKNLVLTEKVTTFRDGSFSIRYVTKENLYKVVSQHKFKGPLKIGQKTTITGLSEIIRTKEDRKEPVELVVLFDGKIGEERGLAVSNPPTMGTGCEGQYSNPVYLESIKFGDGELRYDQGNYSYIEVSDKETGACNRRMYNIEDDADAPAGALLADLTFLHGLLHGGFYDYVYKGNTECPVTEYFYPYDEGKIDGYAHSRCVDSDFIWSLAYVLDDELQWQRYFFETGRGPVMAFESIGGTLFEPLTDVVSCILDEGLSSPYQCCYGKDNYLGGYYDPENTIIECSLGGAATPVWPPYGYPGPDTLIYKGKR